jgi:hypothetical protein
MKLRSIFVLITFLTLLNGCGAQETPGKEFAVNACNQLGELNLDETLTIGELNSAYLSILDESEKAYNANAEYKPILDTALLVKELHNWISPYVLMGLTENDSVLDAILRLIVIDGGDEPKLTVADIRDSFKYTRCETLITEK